MIAARRAIATPGLHPQHCCRAAGGRQAVAAAAASAAQGHGRAGYCTRLPGSRLHDPRPAGFAHEPVCRPALTCVPADVQSKCLYATAACQCIACHCTAAVLGQQLHAAQSGCEAGAALPKMKLYTRDRLCLLGAQFVFSEACSFLPSCYSLSACLDFASFKGLSVRSAAHASVPHCRERAGRAAPGNAAVGGGRPGG